ncbi:LOW QUALITY PROTEIN: hypothetical protein NC652_022418 [Populus alba x Populus x berolinensis]|nr:LOW QUALITY PROTEIN: hypothetical protein NC652_022418 [Populus alba x Populus x berolinensis]
MCSETLMWRLITTWDAIKYIPKGMKIELPLHWQAGASSWVSNCPILVAFLSLSSNQGGLQETASRDDKWKLRIAHYVPGQLNWWMSHKWFPSSSYVEIVPEVYGNRDKQILKMIPDGEVLEVGILDPMELSNPFPHNESFVHIWQGFEDPLLNTSTMFAGSCSGIRYHEVNDGGHLIEYDTNICSKCQPEWNTCFPPATPKSSSSAKESFGFSDKSTLKSLEKPTRSSEATEQAKAQQFRPGRLLSWARLAIHDTQVGPPFFPAGINAMVYTWSITWSITHDEKI